MSDSRTLQTDLVRLVDAGRRPAKTLGERPDAAAIPSAAGSAKPKRPAGSGTGTAGIASPLTETAYEDREHYDAVTVTSTDGIFSFQVRRLKHMEMLDANGAEVVLDFKEPAT